MLTEDIADGDVTTQCIVPSEASLTGQLVAKESGLIAGLEVFQGVFALLDEHTRLRCGSLMARTWSVVR
jgi:nicotinate-nucleotide pyrophosphorylase (carboxylating)